MGVFWQKEKIRALREKCNDPASFEVMSANSP